MNRAGEAFDLLDMLAAQDAADVRISGVALLGMDLHQERRYSRPNMSTSAADDHRKTGIVVARPAHPAVAARAQEARDRSGRWPTTIKI